MNTQGGFWSRPWNDYLRLLQLLAKEFSVLNVIMLLGGVIVGWWFYVPLHELFHAWGCQLSGGHVGRLEISAEYGAQWLQQYFPYIAVGSEYAGQLVEFDTYGNDGIYIATVIAPYILTIYPGIPLFYWLLSRPWIGFAHCFALGFLVPIVIAPFVSIIGDFYELGSIIMSNIGNYLYPGVDTDIWRGDDFLLVLATISPQATPHDWAGVISSLLIGTVMAWVVYSAGVFFRYRPKGHSIGKH
jgi:hypothetical protein